MKTFVWIGLGILAGIALILGGWALFSGAYTFNGSLIDPAIPAADFKLVDQFGQPYRLSEQQGKVVLIFFGYINCPDVCPVTLSEFKQIKKELGNQAGQVEFVFVTVDPERDTQERLQQHLAIFDPAIIGLTGVQSDLEEVYKSYGVYVAKQDTGSAAGYLVDHTARIYVIDRAGNWRLTFPFGTEVKPMVEDILHLLREKG